MLLLVALGGKEVSLEGRVHRSESRSEQRRLRGVQDGRLGSKPFLQIFALEVSMSSEEPAASRWQDAPRPSSGRCRPLWKDRSSWTEGAPATCDKKYQRPNPRAFDGAREAHVRAIFDHVERDFLDKVVGESVGTFEGSATSTKRSQGDTVRAKLT